MKKAITRMLIVCFALVSIVGIVQDTAGPAMGKISTASLIAALCGLFISLLSATMFPSKTMALASVANAVVLLVSFVLRPEPSVRGTQDARRDIAHGRYFLLDHGFPVGVQPKTEQCLRQHGLKNRVVGLDIIDKSEWPYYESYISVMNAAIAQKFSPDVFEQCCRYQPISLRTICHPVE